MGHDKEETMRKLLVLAAMTVVFGSGLNAETFNIDTSHSGVTFKIRHIVTKFTGRFDKFEGTFDYEKGKPKTWKVEAAIDAAGINTKNEKRDGHLRSPDFFDVEKCPSITFKSTKISGVKGDKAKIHGDLTVHCVTKSVILDAELTGIENDLQGKRAGITATTKLNRKDFGITWNKTLDSGGIVLGEEVEVILEIEGVVKKG